MSSRETPRSHDPQSHLPAEQGSAAEVTAAFDDFFAEFGMDSLPIPEPLSATTPPVSPGYPFRLPFYAPEDWTFIESDRRVGELGWSDAGRRYVSNALFAVDRILRASGESELADRLRSVPVLPLDTGDTPEDQAAVGSWSPDDGVIYLNKCIIGDYFQAISTVLHEADHMLHDLRQPATVSDEFQSEVRAHQHTSDRLRTLGTLVESFPGDDADRNLWMREADMLLVVQELGLARYLVLQQFHLQVDHIFGDLLPPIVNDRSKCRRIVEQNIELVETLRRDSLPTHAHVRTARALHQSVMGYRSEFDRLALDSAHCADSWSASINRLERACDAMLGAGCYPPSYREHLAR